MTASLRILKGEGTQRVISLPPGRHDIGRGDDVAIQIDSRRVSRKHAEIVVSEEGARILDCGSANGTLLNGKHVTTADLANGDRITIGEVEMEYSVPTLTPSRPRVRATRSLQFIVMILFSSLLSASVVTSGLAFRSILLSRLHGEALDRGAQHVRLLAEKNREDLRLGNELLLDVESVLREKGVREAYIVNAKGRILAPVSKLSQMANDPFITEALNQKSDRKILPSPPIPGGHRIFVHPIRAYNEKDGIFRTLGAAKIVFSVDGSIGPLSEIHRLLTLLLLLGAAVGLGIGWGLSRTLTRPLLRLAEGVSGWNAGLKEDAPSAPFTEWEPLYDATERALKDRKE